MNRRHLERSPSTKARSPRAASDTLLDLPMGLAIQQPPVVAVIDSGFDLGHPSINYVEPALHFNAVEYFERRQRPGMVSRVPYDAGLSRRPHGTAVAGVIAARRVEFRVGSRPVVIQGIAPGFPIMPIRVGVKPTPNQIAASIRWAVEHGARVINLSLKVTRNAAVAAEIEAAWAAGLVICAASGNFSNQYPFNGVDFPASHPRVIAVGATDGRGRRKRLNRQAPRDWGSQYGPELDVVAPGVNVKTIDEVGPLGNLPGDFSLRGTGTSMACPQVAGLAALLFGIAPTLTNTSVRALIESTCDQLPGYRFSRVRGRPWPWNREVGYGQINPERCLIRLAELLCEPAQGRESQR